MPGRITERTKEDLKASMPEVLQSRFGITNLTKSFKCPAPDHDDQRPSAHYYEKSHTVHCFGCNRTWDVFQLIGLAEGLRSFPEQVQAVAGIIGYQIEYEEPGGERPHPQGAMRPSPEKDGMEQPARQTGAATERGASDDGSSPNAAAGGESRPRKPRPGEPRMRPRAGDPAAERLQARNRLIQQIEERGAADPAASAGAEKPVIERYHIAGIPGKPIGEDGDIVTWEYVGRGADENFTLVVKAPSKTDPKIDDRTLTKTMNVLKTAVVNDTLRFRNAAIELKDDGQVKNAQLMVGGVPVTPKMTGTQINQIYGKMTGAGPDKGREVKKGVELILPMGYARKKTMPDGMTVKWLIKMPSPLRCKDTSGRETDLGGTALLMESGGRGFGQCVPSADETCVHLRFDANEPITLSRLTPDRKIEPVEVMPSEIRAARIEQLKLVAEKNEAQRKQVIETAAARNPKDLIRIEGPLAKRDSHGWYQETSRQDARKYWMYKLPPGTRINGRDCGLSTISVPATSESQRNKGMRYALFGKEEKVTVRIMPRVGAAGGVTPSYVECTARELLGAIKASYARPRGKGRTESPRREKARAREEPFRARELTERFTGRKPN